MTEPVTETRGGEHVDWNEVRPGEPVPGTEDDAPQASS